MKLGISSFTYNWAVGVPGYPPDRPLSVMDLLQRAGELGVRVLQIGDNLPLDRLSAGELAAFSSRASELGVQLEAGTRGIRPEHLSAYLRLASRLRSPILRAVVDTADDRPAPEAVVDRIREIAPDLARTGIRLAVENHDWFPVSTLASILERVASGMVGICMDTTNSFGAGEDPARVIDVLGPLAINVHVKDYAARRMEHNMGMTIEGRPAGQGQLDIPRLIERLKAYGRDPSIVIELWTGPEATLAATIAKEDEWARESVAYLRRFISE